MSALCTECKQCWLRCLRSVDSPKWQKTVTWGEELLNKLCYYCFLCTQKVLSYSFLKYGWTMMSHGLFYRCPCYVSGPGNIALLFMGQRALRFYQKYLNCVSKDEQRSYGFGTTWGWVRAALRLHWAPGLWLTAGPPITIMIYIWDKNPI